MVLAFLGGLGKAPTFLVPIINPPFADNSPHSLPVTFSGSTDVFSTAVIETKVVGLLSPDILKTDETIRRTAMSQTIFNEIYKAGVEKISQSA
ncbi:MAG: hypothetical protein PHU81_02615 [Acidobacteriota bacterium]|nr:hypothetical protein [Acidobacteriota bacterium]